VNVQTLSSSLIAWYQKNKRDLPWRETKDAYSVWVSEIMLQQTRVETVIPYYQNWMQKFPTLQTLAQASEEDVLLQWEGLGYYSRVRNLHHTAQILVQQNSGAVPESIDELKKLPGIGDYTASAIASISFRAKVVALDANGKRIFARLLDVDMPVSSGQAKKQILRFAADQIEQVDAGDFNQAIMDLGSMICLPRRPRCRICPIRNFCIAYQRDTQNIRPVLEKKKAIPLYHVVAAVITDGDDRFLLAKRPRGGMLPGLWEFPGGKIEQGEDDQSALQREIREELDAAISVGELVGSYKHAYTHFRVIVRAYYCSVNGKLPRAVEAQELAWVKCEDIAGFAMGRVDRWISHDICRGVSHEI